MCVCVRDKERKSVCVREREIKRESVCVCERERDSVCVCVSVCVYVCMCVCVYSHKRVCDDGWITCVLQALMERDVGRKDVKKSLSAVDCKLHILNIAK